MRALTKSILLGTNNFGLSACLTKGCGVHAVNPRSGGDVSLGHESRLRFLSHLGRHDRVRERYIIRSYARYPAAFVTSRYSLVKTLPA